MLKNTLKKFGPRTWCAKKLFSYRVAHQNSLMSCPGKSFTKQKQLFSIPDFSLSPEPARLLSPLHHQHPRRGRRTFWTLSESSLELGSPHRLHQGKLSSRGIFSWESRWCERWLHRGATA